MMKFLEWDHGRTAIYYRIPVGLEDYYDGYFRRGIHKFLSKYIDERYIDLPEQMQVDALCACILEVFLDDLVEYRKNLIKEINKMEREVKLLDEWETANKVKRSVLIPEDLDAKITLMSSVDGTNYSKMLSRVIRKAIERGDVRSEINRFKGHLLRLDLMEAEKRIELYKQKLQKLIELEEEVKNAIREKLGYIELGEAFDLMVKIIEWFDQRGFYVRGFEEENPDIVNRLNDIFKENFGCEFPLREFAERVWLREEMNIREFVDAVKRGEFKDV